MSLRTAIVLLVLLPLVARAEDPPKKDPKVRFAELSKELKAIRKSPDWEKIKERRDVVVELGNLDQPGVAELLYEVFAEDREQVCRIPAMIGIGKRGSLPVLKAMVTAAVRDRNDVYRMTLPVALGFSKDPDVGPWLVKTWLRQKNDPVLKAATIEALGNLRCAEAFDPIREIFGTETRDVRISYECLLAMGKTGGAAAVDAILPSLESPERFLREGAVIALGETGGPDVLEKVLPLAKDDFPRAQEAVAEVIRKLGADEGIPTLIGLLGTGRLRVMDAAREALEAMTGEKLGLDAGAWEKWVADKKAGKLPEKDPAGDATSVATYYGMRIFSDRVLFVVDVSGSMDAGTPMRIDTAREELAKTLGMLNEKTMFNVVGFSGSPMWWKDAEVEAGKANVADAKAFVAKLSVGGGTNIYDTLEEALEKNRLIDTIYFLGDGSPSLGKYVEQEEILARLRFLNRFRKVRIHTIALIRGEVARFGGRNAPGLGRGISISGERAYDEEEAARFLARMAAEHGGSSLVIE